MNDETGQSVAEEEQYRFVDHSLGPVYRFTTKQVDTVRRIAYAVGYLRIAFGRRPRYGQDTVLPIGDGIRHRRRDIIVEHFARSDVWSVCKERYFLSVWPVLDGFV